MPKVKIPGLLPNSGSKIRTPGSLLIDTHYATLNIVRRWNWERFHRLAAYMRLTHGELASLICLTHAKLPSIQRNNVFPGPAALLLTIIEARYMANTTDDVISDPFPKNAPS